MNSIAYHAPLRDKFVEEPNVNEINQTIVDVVDMLEVATWRIPDNFLTRDHYEEILKDIEWDSSPGYPWCIQYTTNRQLFKVVDGQVCPVQSDMVWQIVQARLEDRGHDPIRLFIKPEPHSQKKVREGRFRLISSVSIIDQLIDQMLFGSFNNRLIDTHGYHPIKTGWTPYIGGWKQIPVSGFVCADKSSWDWTVKPWLNYMDLEIRKELCRNLTDQWIELAEWRYQKLFGDGCEFITSGGLHLFQEGGGVMKSGCVNTISSNSIMQCILHCMVSRRLDMEPGMIWCMGDDTMQTDMGEDSEAYFTELEKFCIIKEIHHHSEFAGFRFNGMKKNPIYPFKHAFNLLHVEDSIREQLATSYALLYHRSVNQRGMTKILGELVEKLPPSRWFDIIWDGES